MIWCRPLLPSAVLALAVAFFAAGCGGGDCESLCEQAQDCEGNQGLNGDGCAAECAKAEDNADEVDCGDQFDDYVDCIADAPDVCNIDESECQSEGISYALCVFGYCQDNPKAPTCESAGVGCTSYATGGEPDCLVAESCGEGLENSMSCGGDSCVCSVDGNEQATVPYDASFCTGDLDDQVAAAASACGW